MLRDETAFLAEMALRDAADRISEADGIAGRHALRELQFCNQLLSRYGEQSQKLRDQYASYVLRVCISVENLVPRLSVSALRIEVEVLLREVLWQLDKIGVSSTRDDKSPFLGVNGAADGVRRS